MEQMYVEGIEVKDYNRLRELVGWPPLPIEQAQAGLKGSSYVVSCQLEGETVGTARVIGDGGYVAYIADVMVAPAYQGQGIGKALMQKLIQHLKCQLKEGWGIMIVLVAAQGKQDFYKAFGFEERPNEVLGPGMSQWIQN